MRRWIVAEFAAPETSLEAARRLRASGLTGLDLHSPFPIEGSDEALGLRPSPIPGAVLCGGLIGAGFGYWLQWFCNAHDFPINVGGRPLQSAPAFVPIVFELGVLFGSAAAFFGMFVAARLPRLHHPVFEADGFRSASVDRFWLSASLGPGDDPEHVRARLADLGALRVEIVPEENP